MKDARHIFISFKTEEHETARLFQQALSAAGYNVWWQENIQCGQEWHGEIDRALTEASAVVVLWSTAALASPWVNHEASQAIAKNIYAPARIELIEINEPYNRLQAVDIINWQGEREHPGFQALLQKMHTLMPPPVPFWQEAISSIWSNRLSVILFFIASIAMLLMAQQNEQSKTQAQNQEFLLKKLEQQIEAQDKQNILQQKMLRSSTEQNKAVIAQAIEQKNLNNIAELQGQTLANQSIILQRQIKQQNNILKNIIRTSQPLENISTSILLSLPNNYNNELQRYTNIIRNQVMTNGLANKILPDGVQITDNGKSMTVDISPSSPLWPSSVDYPILRYEADFIKVFLIFSKDTMRFSNSLTIALCNYTTSDFVNKLNSHISIFFPDKKNKDLPIIRLALEGSISPSMWKSNGDIISVPDIERSLIEFFVVDGFDPASIKNISYQQLWNNRSKIELHSLIFRYSGRTKIFHSGMNELSPSSFVYNKESHDYRIKFINGFIMAP